MSTRGMVELASSVCDNCICVASSYVGADLGGDGGGDRRILTIDLQTPERTVGALGNRQSASSTKLECFVGSHQPLVAVLSKDESGDWCISNRKCVAIFDSGIW